MQIRANVILSYLHTSDPPPHPPPRRSTPWRSWRSQWTSGWASGRWSRSPAHPCGRCQAPGWLAWRTWATAATSTLSCKCSSLCPTFRPSEYPCTLLRHPLVTVALADWYSGLRQGVCNSRPWWYGRIIIMMMVNNHGGSCGTFHYSLIHLFRVVFIIGI